MSGKALNKAIITAFFTAACLFLSHDVRGQWRVIQNFGSTIETIYFLDDLGKPSIGFAALKSGNILRTTNRGNTWSPVLISTTGWGLDFTFKDTLRGWCVGSGGIVETTDGGSSWFMRAAYPEFHSCYYNKFTKLLFVNAPYTSGMVSTDDGATWSTCLPDQMLGFAFVDSVHGISTTYYGVHYYTADGGITWTPSNFGVETWQPIAIPGTHSFLACSENFIGTNTLYRSDNYGKTWRTIQRFNDLPHLTGCIAGGRGGIYYLQSDDGVIASTDTGYTWHTICGPGTYHDTRFFAFGDTVFAGDRNGQLWMTPIGGIGDHPTDLQISPRPPFYFDNNHCANIYQDFTIGNYNNCEALRIQVDSITMKGSPHFALVWPTSFPAFINILDPIQTVYITSPSLFDSTKLIIYYSLLGEKFDTTIMLYGEKHESPNNITIKPALITKQVLSPCYDLDTTITITGNQCDTLIISDLQLSPGTVFSIQSPLLPFPLPPDSTIMIRLTARTTVPGIFNDKITITFLSRAKTLVDTIPLLFEVKSKERLNISLSPSRFDLGRVSICTSAVKSFFMKDPSCQPLFITGIKWVSPPGDFSIDRQFPLPKQFSFNEGDSISFLFEPTYSGLEQATIDITFERDGDIWDTTVTISATGTTNAEASCSPDTLNFAPILSCHTAKDTVLLRNISCDAEQITEINYDQSRGFSIISPNKSDWIGPGTSVPVVIEFSSNTAGSFGIPIEFRLHSAKGADVAATMNANISVKDTLASIFIDPTNLLFDTVSICKNTTQIVKIQNPSTCESILLESVVVNGDPDFQVGPFSPSLLAPLDSLAIELGLNPLSEGPHTADIHLRLKSTIRTWDTIIHLNGFVLGKRHELYIGNNNIDLGEFSECQTKDTMVLVKNTGCEKLTITSLNLLGMGFELASTSLPVIIEPGESHAFGIRMLNDTSGHPTSTTAYLSFTSDAENFFAPIQLVRRFRYPDLLTLSLLPMQHTDSAVVPFRLIVDSASILGKISANMIHLHLNYDTDLLTLVKAEGPNRYEIKDPLNMNIFGSPVESDLNGSIADLKFSHYLSKHSGTSLSIGEVFIYQGQTILDSCTLILRTDSTTYLYSSECGDTTIRQFIRFSDPEFGITSVYPNPATSDIIIQLRNASLEPVILKIISMLGTTVYQTVTSFPTAGKISIPIIEFQSGLYFVETIGSHSMSSSSFVITR
jgi:photosystem II stability/assembly factor-like uncharacterized protein